VSTKPGVRSLFAFADRFEALRRDAASVVGGFLGRTPPPSVKRAPLSRHSFEPAGDIRGSGVDARGSGVDARGSGLLASSGELLSCRRLRVERVVRETRDSVSLHLSDPAGAPIAFAPGQFLTLQSALPGGQPLKRAYSLSALPGQGEAASRARITIKRVAGGVVSNHLNEHAREGDMLTVLGPSGSFGIEAEEARGKHLLLIGGGSGITPLRPILEASLQDPSVTATLLYGNRSEEDIIFRAELDAIARSASGRCAVRHVLDSPPAVWTGGAGLLDRPTSTREIAAILSSELAAGRTTEVLVCGPTPMMDAVRLALSDIGVARERIREEQFSSPDQRKAAGPTSAQPATFKIRGVKRDTVAAAGQTLLEAGLAAGLNMPFSCAMGGCGACRLKLVSGSVVAEEPNCLSPKEAGDGFVLACVSRAAAPVSLELE
jgi:ring-1,2-phenylacetyl-CoA epoxidase subunit PaaE